MRTPHLRICAAAFLIPALAAALATPTEPPECFDALSLDCVILSQQSEYVHLLVARDGDHGGHGHSHHAAPMIELNETEVEMSHGTTPPSYYWHDFMEPSNNGSRYPGLMGRHALFMSLAFFGALPIGASPDLLPPKPDIKCALYSGIALRSVKHAWHGVTVFMFYGFVVLGLSTSALYRKLTPDMSVLLGVLGPSEMLADA